MGRSRTRQARKKTNAEIQAELQEMAWAQEERELLNRLSDISKLRINKEIKNKNPKQKDLCKAIVENQITFVSGPAGTGKTLMALKTALELLKKDNEYSKILLTKPIVEAGESIGFLPGDIDSKTDPYMGSFIGSISKLVGKTMAGELMKSETIVSAPLAYLRGETFENSIAIIDEAQNTTKSGLKLWLSRKGETSKLIVLGDTRQTDLYLRNGHSSGLEDAFKRFPGVPGVGFIEFTEDEIVRSDILIELMKRYNNNLEEKLDSDE